MKPKTKAKKTPKPIKTFGGYCVGDWVYAWGYIYHNTEFDPSELGLFRVRLVLRSEDGTEPHFVGIFTSYKECEELCEMWCSDQHRILANTRYLRIETE